MPPRQVLRLLRAGSIGAAALQIALTANAAFAQTTLPTIDVGGAKPVKHYAAPTAKPTRPVAAAPAHAAPPERTTRPAPTHVAAAPSRPSTA